MMKFLTTVACICSIVIAGCGGGPTGGNDPKNSLLESQRCIDCHGSSHQGSVSLTPGTQKPVVDEWSASSHNLKNGASCPDCHGSGYLHESLQGQVSCSGCHSIGGGQAVNPLKNPDQLGRCANCHDKVNPRPGKNDGYTVLSADYFDPNGKIPTNSTTGYLHFSSGSHGMYVATNYKQNCRKCHNPHDTSLGLTQRKQWAQSGHGSTTTNFRVSTTDFKTRGSAIIAENNFGNYCVRCHTSTGYIKYVESGFRDVEALPDIDGAKSNYPKPSFTYKDRTRETTNCNVCHEDANKSSSYSGRLRVIDTVTTYFNYSTSPKHPRTNSNPQNPAEGSWDVKTSYTYPNFSNSNICVVCHGGREIGRVLRISAAKGNDFSNTATRPVFAHDRNAASTLSSISGFEFYTSRTLYLDSNLRHNTINSVSSVGPNQGRNNGPCISCHMENDSSHHFLPVERSKLGDPQSVITNVISNTRICSQCHNSGAGWLPNDLNVIKNGYKASLFALQKLIANKLGFKVSTTSLATVTGFDTANSYSATKWGTLGTALVPELGGLPQSTFTIGSAYNLEMFQLDPGAYAHNPVYVRRLIFDSIDWLSNSTMDMDTKSALTNLNTLGVANGGIDNQTYADALKYLCRTKTDTTGSLGQRP